MSRAAVEQITGKIVLDAGFRASLLATPEQTLSAFELSEREKAGLKCLDSETMEALAQTLAVRLRRLRFGPRGTLLDFLSGPTDRDKENG